MRRSRVQIILPATRWICLRCPPRFVKASWSASHQLGFLTNFCSICNICLLIYSEDFKLEKGPTDKAKEPDPGGSDQQNLGFKKLKTEKLTVRLD